MLSPDFPPVYKLKTCLKFTMANLVKAMENKYLKH